MSNIYFQTLRGCHDKFKQKCYPKTTIISFCKYDHLKNLKAWSLFCISQILGILIQFLELSAVKTHSYLLSIFDIFLCMATKLQLLSLLKNSSANLFRSHSIVHGKFKTEMHNIVNNNGESHARLITIHHSPSPGNCLNSFVCSKPQKELVSRPSGRAAALLAAVVNRPVKDVATVSPSDHFLIETEGLWRTGVPGDTAGLQTRAPCRPETRTSSWDTRLCCVNILYIINLGVY